MKHCCFSILYNELPFLKQKLPFLYKYFDQIILYDLHVDSKTFSTDGSHEYIKKYPDPKNKITLIEKKDLSGVKGVGISFETKRKMFAVGSRYVRNDIDVFWCPDLDEFFSKSLISKVEKLFSSKSGTIMIPHVIFFKNEKFVFCKKNGDDRIILPYSRIAKHKPGNVYGHCNIQNQHKPLIRISDEFLFHFAYVGKNKMKFKKGLYARFTPKIVGYYNDVWKNFDESKVGDDVYGFPNMHPALQVGIKRHSYNFPDYINIHEMINDLYV